MVERRIFLFDVDGVIVNPVAYRLGVGKTLSALCEKIGLANSESILPSEADISALEAQGVHDVWDITNIIFCDILTTISLQANLEDVRLSQLESAKGYDFDAVSSQNTDAASSQSVHAASSQNSDAASVPKFDISSVPASETTGNMLSALRKLNACVARPDYHELANKLAPTEAHSHPPDIAMEMLSQKLKGVNHNKFWMDLLERFLTGTRSAYSSYGTRLFQNIILGAEDFARTYELSSEYPGQGLLRTEDKTIISSESVDQLLRLNKNAHDAVGVYTARPSLPPNEAEISSVGYSPEAEIALENAGMQSFPLIGMGMMEWLGKQRNQRTEDLTKPNTTQALAGLINTITGGRDVAALIEAYAIDKEDRAPEETSLSAIRGDSTIVYVFEDTISGIIPLKRVVQMLQLRGFKIHLEALGIAVDTSKRLALEKHCTHVYPDVNQAFRSICPSHG